MHIARERSVAALTQNQALAALLSPENSHRHWNIT
jgi:hypothetical protein